MKKLLIIAAVATFFFSCKEEKKENIITVGVMDVEYNDTSYSRSYPGLVSTSQYKVLFSVNGGTVESVNVRTGKKVTSGNVIAQVHSPNVVSMYNANKAQLHQAEESYKRAGKVYEGGGISEIKWLEIQAMVAKAESAYEISEKSLEDCKIKAPFSGTINEIFVTEGETIQPMAKIASIINEDDLSVTIAVPESEYSDMKIGDQAMVEIVALDKLMLKAAIEKISVNSSIVTHSYSMSLRLESLPGNVKSGMLCKVYMKKDLKQKIVLPVSSVKVDDSGRYVWTVNDGKVRKCYVTVGDFIGDGVSVTSGLEIGDHVVVQGMNKISTGMKVKTVSAK